MQKRIIIWVAATVLGLLLGAAISVSLPPMRLGTTVAPSKSRHLSFWVRAGYYEPLFAAVDAQPVVKNENVVAAIVNHHLFAPDLIAKTLHAISGAQPSVVVLISPNHFSIGNGGFITSTGNWTTMAGDLAGAADLAQALGRTGYVIIDESVFEKEHGIFNDVTFVRRYFPETKLLPIVVREQVAAAGVDRLAKLLNDLLPPDALVIGSFDFSHYKKDAVAKANDAASMRVLEQLDVEHTAGLDIDSTKGLRLLLRFARLRGAAIFHLTGHSSSAERIGDPETIENTSYITGFFAAP